MAYSLQSSGLATFLTACVAVDDDGTIKDFVSGNTVSLDTGVAASVATGSWKSISSPQYFVTTANGSFDFNGVRWTGTKPAANETDSDGLTAWFACDGASAVGGLISSFLEIGSTIGTAGGLRRVSTGDAHGTYARSGGTRAITTTNLPTDGTTKFSFGMTYRSGVSSEAFYGLESGSLASEATSGSDGGFGSSGALAQAIGGSAGSGNQPHKPYIHCVFNKIITLSEMQSLHDDWFGTLFDAPGNQNTIAWIRA